jgi:hypothetical protein
MEARRRVSAVEGVCLPRTVSPDLTRRLALVVVFILIMVVLGADPALALGSFAVIAGAAARMTRS